MTTYEAMHQLAAVIKQQRNAIPEHIWEAQEETWLMNAWDALADLEHHLEHGNCR